MLTPFGMIPKYVRFRVAGIFDSGFYDYDSSWAFTRLSDAQHLFALGDVIQIIEFKIDDIYKAAEVGQELEKSAGWREVKTRPDVLLSYDVLSKKE